MCLGTRVPRFPWQGFFNGKSPLFGLLYTAERANGINMAKGAIAPELFAGPIMPFVWMATLRPCYMEGPVWSHTGFHFHNIDNELAA